jgi:hypothetical protein
MRHLEAHIAMDLETPRQEMPRPYASWKTWKDEAKNNNNNKKKKITNWGITNTKRTSMITVLRPPKHRN